MAAVHYCTIQLHVHVGQMRARWVWEVWDTLMTCRVIAHGCRVLTFLRR